jgi:hypothetical protein
MIKPKMLYPTLLYVVPSNFCPGAKFSFSFFKSLTNFSNAVESFGEFLNLCYQGSPDE